MCKSVAVLGVFLFCNQDWSHSQFDIRYDDEWIFPDGAAVESEMYFARVLFGVADGAQISGHIGVTEIDSALDDSDYHSGNDLAWGVGSKLNFGRMGPCDLGVAFQFTSLRADDRTFVGPLLIREKHTAYLFELAVGPTYQTHGVSIYGGPFLHIITGEEEGWIDSMRAGSMDIEEEGSEVGGYAGISVEAATNTNIALEYQFTDDSWAIGAGIVHRFGGRQPTRNAVRTRPWPRLPRVEPAEKTVPTKKLKVGADGKPLKDGEGNFIFEPVEK
jgi:hypothetical protein